MPRVTIAPILVSLALAASVFAAEKLEVASVRMVPRGKAGTPSWSPYGGASFTATNMSLELLVQLAFGVPGDRITGADRLAGDFYDVAVKPENGGPLSYERLKPLLRSVLEDRFRLKTHTETKEVQGYELVVAKGGPKLQAGKGFQGNNQIYPGGLSGSDLSLDSLA